jgi:hypothetical protein
VEDALNLAWVENLGGSPPTLVQHPIPNSGWCSYEVTAVFFNQDAFIDIVAVSSCTSRLSWFASDGGSPPRFTEHLLAAGVPIYAYSLRAVDGERASLCANSERWHLIVG